MGRIEDKRDPERVQILGELRGEVTVFQPMALQRIRREGADGANSAPDGVDTRGELRAEVTVFQPMAIKEISRGGAQVETGFPLQLGSLHEFRLTLAERSIILTGRVAHCSISDIDQDVVLYRSGMEFIEPPDHVTDVIAHF